jgi:hypothetical protein
MKVAVEIRVAFLEQLSLMSRTHAAARSFAVACVQLVDDAHALYDVAKWREAHCVEARLIPRVDVNLRRTSVWAGHSKRERSSHVGVFHGIVGEPFVLPNLRNHGIARNAELRESARNHAEEPRIIVEAYLDEMVERSAPRGANARVTPSRMMPFVVSMRTRYILGAGCDHSESCGSCSARERSSGATVCGAAASSVVNAMKTDKRPNRVISRRRPLALGSFADDRLGSGATRYVIAVGVPTRQLNAKRRLVSRQDSKAQQRIDLPIQKLERLEADFPL